MFLVNPVPEVGYDVPTVYYTSVMTGRNVDDLIAPSYREYLERTREVTEVFEKIIKNNIELIDPTRLLCDEQICNVQQANIPLYRDDDHLSTYGARFISPTFDIVFNQKAILYDSAN